MTTWIFDVYFQCFGNRAMEWRRPGAHSGKDNDKRDGAKEVAMAENEEDEIRRILSSIVHVWWLNLGWLGEYLVAMDVEICLSARQSVRWLWGKARGRKGQARPELKCEPQVKDKN